jgi:uncharacterized damage-inducible protein DinB
MNTSLAKLTAMLSLTPHYWMLLTAIVPDELLRYCPGEGEWSASSCLQHIIDTEHMFAQRFAALRQGRDVPIFDRSLQELREFDHATPATLALTFFHLRANNLALLSQLVEDDLRRESMHPELGSMSLSELLHAWAAHDLDHSIQATRVLMQLFIEGSGPWQTYFVSNINATLPLED